MKGSRSHTLRQPATVYGKPWQLIVWLLATTSIAVTFLATRSGSGITPDSTTYIAAARNLARGNGYSDYAYGALVHWPPGYSALLAAGDVVGIDAFSGARIINALAFGAIVLLASVLLRRHVRSWLVSVVALLVIAWSQPMLASASYALSEPVFCAQVLAFLIVLENAVGRTDRRWVLILAAAGIAGSAYLVRYAGLALIAAGFMTFVLSPQRKPRDRLVEGIGYGLAASVVPVIWTVRNIWVAGSISDSGSPSGDTVLDVARSSLYAISELFLPQRIPVAVRVLALIALVLVCWVGYRLSKRAPSVVEPKSAASLLPLMVFLVAYLAFLLVSRLTTGVDPPSLRFLIPTLAPVVVLAAWCTEELSLRLRQTRRALVALFTASILVYALGAAGWFWAYSIRTGRAGRGYDAARWEESLLIDRVRRRLPQHARQVVYSNRPSPIYWVTGREPVRWFTGGRAVAQGVAPSSAELVEQLEEDAACDRDSFLAWFRADGVRPYIGDDLASNVRFTAIERVADGTLYRVRLQNDFDGRGARSCS